tara:strand:+ start:5221 stop:6429 length:1209 start_codon:yes stop_codon:yes gene_type:complete
MTNKNKYLDVIKAYIRALDNEASLSVFWSRHYGKSEKVNWVPDSAIINRNFHMMISLLSRVYYIVVLSWLLVMPILFIVEYMRWGKKNLKKDKLQCRNIFLYCSPGSNFNFIDNEAEFYPSTGIILPWGRVNKTPEKLSLIDIREISSFQVFLISCGLSYLVMLRVIFDPKRIGSVLFTYTALRWFFVRLTLEGNEFRSIWVTNHYDRWGISVDGLATYKRIMVQHGSLIDKSHDEFVSYVIQNKLMNKWELYLYANDESRIFNECLFGSPPELKVFEIEISLDKILCCGQKSVLILGDSRLQDKFIGISWILQKKYDGNLTILYRPHQRENIKNLKTENEELNLIINDDERRIPETSVVLSYDSSLDELLLNTHPANIVRFDTTTNFNENHIVANIHKALG